MGVNAANLLNSARIPRESSFWKAMNPGEDPSKFPAIPERLKQPKEEPPKPEWSIVTKTTEPDDPGEVDALESYREMFQKQEEEPKDWRGRLAKAAPTLAQTFLMAYQKPGLREQGQRWVNLIEQQKQHRMAEQEKKENRALRAAQIEAQYRSAVARRAKPKTERYISYKGEEYTPEEWNALKSTGAFGEKPKPWEPWTREEKIAYEKDVTAARAEGKPDSEGDVVTERGIFENWMEGLIGPESLSPQFRQRAKQMLDNGFDPNKYAALIRQGKLAEATAMASATTTAREKAQGPFDKGREPGFGEASKQARAKALNIPAELVDVYDRYVTDYMREPLPIVDSKGNVMLNDITRQPITRPRSQFRGGREQAKKMAMSDLRTDYAQMFQEGDTPTVVKPPSVVKPSGPRSSGHDVGVNPKVKSLYEQ